MNTLKLRIKLAIALMFAIGIFVFIGCDKNEDNVLVEEQNIPFSYKKVAENPLEYIGIEHNIFMREFMSILEESYKQHEWENITAFDDKFSHKFASIMNQSCHNLYSKTKSTIDMHAQLFKDMYIEEWFDGDEITSLNLAKDVLDETASGKDKEFTVNLLNDVFEVLKRSVNDKDAFKALNIVITEHEKLILVENWKEEETYALGALAVAKYSVIFWEAYDFSVFNDAKKPDTRNSIVVGSDVAGFVIGGVTGATAGSFAGPAGTVGGFLGGKAAGAFTGSTVAAAAISVYDHICDFFS